MSTQTLSQPHVEREEMMAGHSQADYMRDAWEPGWLDPADVKLHTNAAWGLCLTLGAERSWLGVRVVRAFPLSHAQEYLAFLNRKNDEIGTVRSLAGLELASRRLAEAELANRYLVNAVQEVHSLRSEGDTLYFDVFTPRGRREFVVRANRETVVRLANGRVLLVDVDGNRFEVPAVEKLDAASQAVLQQVM